MSDVILKRKVGEATQRIMKNAPPDVEGVGLLCAALGDLLGQWTGQRVRILIFADDQSDAIDMVKTPQRVKQ